MIKKAWLLYLAAYFFWAVSLALAIWLLLVARNTIPAILAKAILGSSAKAAQLHIIFDRVFVLLGGMGWLVVMTILEQYYRKAVPLGRLWPRVARVIGILLLLLFLVDASQVIMTGVVFAAWDTWLLLLVEAAAGITLARLSRSRQAPA